MTKPTEAGAAIVATLEALIAIPSAYPADNTAAICAYTAERLKKAGYAVEVIEPVKGTANVVAKIGKGKPSLVFNAHADTVGVGDRSLWKTDPFKGHVEGNQVFGLGAGNCKGSMAVQIVLAEMLAKCGGPKTGEVVFTFVGDEENLGPDGMAHLRKTGAVKPDMLILGAQTENQLITAERGVLWAKISTTGKAAHAGTPEAGDNAILRLMRVLTKIEAELGPKLAARVDGAMKSTINLGLFNGGHNTNVVPASATAEIDRRLLPTETVDQAYAELEALVKAAGEPAGTVTIEKLRGTNGFRAPADGTLVKGFSAEIEKATGAPTRFLNAAGVSDGRYFADDGIEIVNFGPGAGVQGHAANESVPIDQMVQSYYIQLGLIDRLLGVG